MSTRTLERYLAWHLCNVNAPFSPSQHRQAYVVYSIAILMAREMRQRRGTLVVLVIISLMSVIVKSNGEQADRNV